MEARVYTSRTIHKDFLQWGLFLYGSLHKISLQNFGTLSFKSEASVAHFDIFNTTCSLLAKFYEGKISNFYFCNFLANYELTLEIPLNFFWKQFLTYIPCYTFENGFWSVNYTIVFKIFVTTYLKKICGRLLLKILSARITLKKACPTYLSSFYWFYHLLQCFLVFCSSRYGKNWKKW